LALADFFCRVSIAVLRSSSYPAELCIVTTRKYGRVMAQAVNLRPCIAAAWV
jgi:hypothetical protein